MSDNKGLYKALLKYQKEGVTVTQDGENKFFNNAKYATVGHIVKTIMPKLNECGLVVTQEPHTDAEGLVTVVTRLIHADTGENISCAPSCTTDGTAQKVGSAITYLRRYGFSLIGLVTDDDDDGNTASEKGKQSSSEVGKVEGKSEDKKATIKKITDICYQIADFDKEQAAGVLYEVSEWKDKKNGRG